MQGENVPLTTRYFKSDVYDAYDCERMIRGLKVPGLFAAWVHGATADFLT